MSLTCTVSFHGILAFVINWIDINESSGLVELQLLLKWGEYMQNVQVCDPPTADGLQWLINNSNSAGLKKTKKMLPGLKGIIEQL